MEVWENRVNFCRTSFLQNSSVFAMQFVKYKAITDSGALIRSNTRVMF